MLGTVHAPRLGRIKFGRRFFSVKYCCFHESYSRSDYLPSLSRCLAVFLTVFFVALSLLWLQRYWKVWQYETAEVRSGGKTSKRNHGQAILAKLVLHHWSLFLFLPLVHIPRLPLQAPNIYLLIFSCSSFNSLEGKLFCFSLDPTVFLIHSPATFSVLFVEWSLLCFLTICKLIHTDWQCLALHISNVFKSALP